MTNIIFTVGESSTVVKPYRFRMSEIEGFRYRVSVSLFLLASPSQGKRYLGGKLGSLEGKLPSFLRPCPIRG